MNDLFDLLSARSTFMNEKNNRVNVVTFTCNEVTYFIIMTKLMVFVCSRLVGLNSTL